MIEEGVVSKDKLTVLSRSKKGVRPAIPRLVGRFEVMALLQAARYYALTGDLEKAKSFGLNRAIFYAWAKHYGRVIKPWRAQAGAKALGRSNVKITKVLGEEVPASESGWFIIGDKEQLPQDFDRQVVGKVSSVLPFEVAWDVTLQYIKKFPENILRNHQRFFKFVYEPVRDDFIEKVVFAKDLNSLVARSLGYLMQQNRSRQKPKVNSEVKRSPSTVTFLYFNYF